MDFLLAFTLFAIMAAAIIAAVIVRSTRRAATAAITRHFKAAEYILTHHQPPPQWQTPPWRKRLFSQSPRQNTPADMLDRLDELIRFFEHSPFFEDEWTRQQLLTQLDQERQNWEVSLPLE